MLPLVYDRAALVDTCVAYAFIETGHSAHELAKRLLASAPDLAWCVLNSTSHETFTRLRYDKGLEEGLAGFELLRDSGLYVLTFDESDERAAIASLKKYKDQKLSFHDALCAAVMKRNGIYRVLSLDADFHTWGFEVLQASL